MTQTNSEDQETFVNKENKEIIDEQSGDETNEKDDQLLLMTPKVILKRLNQARIE